MISVEILLFISPKSLHRSIGFFVSPPNEHGLSSRLDPVMITLAEDYLTRRQSRVRAMVLRKARNLYVRMQ